MSAAIEVVALHTSVEANAMFVRQADDARDLGPASARPYIDMAALEQALVALTGEEVPA